MRREERLRIARMVSALPEIPLFPCTEETGSEVPQLPFRDYTIPSLSAREIRMHHRDAMLIRQMARLISREHGILVRSARIFDFLRREGWLLSLPDCYNAPSEESTRRGFILAGQSGSTGSGMKYYTPYITREGYEFFSRIIIQKGGHI